ncbi:hypothetical protein [Azonexus sp.]|uniref:hypothetical protein n=1 Tax=Azonexus sp. TaxID=1872668 RepID=UPI0027B98CAE|nr:hypothetical protein [Azonexus sp.]
MKRGSPTRQRLAAIGLCGIPLLTYPLLGLPKGSLAGIPMIVFYLFGVWAGLIALAAWIAERRNA